METPAEAAYKIPAGAQLAITLFMRQLPKTFRRWRNTWVSLRTEVGKPCPITHCHLRMDASPGHGLKGRADRLDESLMRLALFTVLPMSLGGAIVAFDRTASDAVRRAEALLIPLFIVGVGGGGMTAFIEHVRSSQLLAGFASLGVALLGAVAAERRDRFREVTVVAAMVLGVGVVADIITPVVLLALLVGLRRVETEPPTIVLRSWMVPVRRGSVATVAIIALALPVGHAMGQAMATSVAAIAVGAGVFWWIVGRSASHRVSA
jgi:hypothetical protein